MQCVCHKPYMNVRKVNKRIVFVYNRNPNGWM
jgi:hypothetical protein